MKRGLWKKAMAITALVAAVTVQVQGKRSDERNDENEKSHGRRARNVIFFVGDGMGVSTVSAARVFAVGVSGKLVGSGDEMG